MHFDSDYFVRLLDRHFLTYEDMAERVGVTKTTIYRWASGRVEPSKRNVVKVAGVFGIEPATLMKEDEGVPMQPNRYDRMR